MKKDYGEKMKPNEIRNTLGEQIARRPAFTIGAGIIVVAAVIVVLNGNRSGEGNENEPLFTVKSGPLTINVSESGRLKNKDEIVLKNETQRSLKILSIAEEGAQVKKGDIILHLDSDNLETARDNAILSVKRIESDLFAAQKQREILKNQKQADIDQAEVTLKFAKLDLKRFSEGVHPNSIASAQANITMAEANLERAEKDHTWSKTLYEKGYITQRDLKADELTAKQNSITVQIRNDDLKLLETFTHPQAIENQQSNVKQAEMALLRANMRSEAELASQQAGLFHHEASLKEAKKELKRAQARLDACNITAPADGMVVYGTSGSKGQEGRDLMEVGATVHPMHKLIRMPMSDVMLAEMSVQEATKPKLFENMEAVVTLDALPGQVFTGKLIKIGILPDSTQAWLNPDLKVYECEVELDSGSEEMRPGMNCHVDIVIQEHENAFFVPIQCVVHVDGKPTVFLKKGGGFKKHVVETGMDNNVMIHILSGLEDGDQVRLNPPLDEAAKKNGNGFSADKSADQAANESVTEPK